MSSIGRATSNVSQVAVWNGEAWEALGTGVNGIVRALAVVDGALYVGGTFTVAGGQSATNVARWQGDAWSALGAGVPGDGVVALTPADGAVLAGQTYEVSAGYRPVRILRWTGTAWEPMDQEFTGQERNRVSALLPTASGFVAGGYFREVDGAAMDSLAIWDGSRWHSLELGLNGAVDVFSAQGDDLYVGGTFVSAGHVAVNHIARWDGDHWEPLGVGHVTGVNGRVRALARGPGGDLFVGGHFLEAGDQPANRIARWDGNGWHALGTGPNNGVNGTVRALVFGDRGELYVGGEFNSAGGLSARGVARWQDGAWDDMGGGVNYQVYALVWNGGNLYAGGSFMTAGDVPVTSVARWDGTRWHPLGPGIESLDASPVVLAMAARGTDLYVGGQFQPGATQAGQHLRRWDGAVWHDLPGPFEYSGRITSVAALEVVGDHLYVGGTFARIAGDPMHGIARWDGTEWQGLGTGTGPATSDSSVNAIALHGSDLFVGGNFGEAGSRAALRIGAWRLPNQPPRVEIIDPSPDALFHTGADITLAADAIDPDGTVTRVRFLVDGIVVGETQGPVYEVVWPDVFAGDYQVVAEATDNTGTTTASTARQIRVVPPPWNLAPTVTWLSPAVGPGFTAGDAILLEAEAQDEDGSIRQVTFYADNEALGVVHAAPYRLTWSNPTPGTVALSVIAMDNLGATSEPAIMAVPFQYPPEVYMSQPYNGDRFVDPATIDLAADARDPDGEIIEVEFFVNGEFLAVAETISSPNYYYRWLDVPVGQYTITSAATDDFGARVLSAPITIHVEPPNLPPEIRIISPAADAQFAAPTNMVVVTEATDPDGEIVRVDLLSHDLLLATTTNAPFTFALRNLTATTYCLVARAMDDRGAISSSEPVCVIVTYDPERVPRYTFKDLGAGVLYEGQAYGLNERGVVVGDGQNLNRDQRGFIYDDGQFTFLEMPNDEFSGFQSTPLAVNDAGVVVGYASDGSGAARAFVLEDGRMRNLGAFSEPHLATASFAFAINSSGVVVGSAEVPERMAHAFRYAGGSLEDLGMFGGIESVARAINDRGDIVGDATLGIDDVQAFLLPHAGPVQFLGTLGGARSQARGISSAGLIVGNSVDDRGATKAFLNYWGYMVDLGTLGGSESHALAVNRYDQIVGSARSMYHEPRAFLWHGTVMYDLNQLVPTNTPVTLIEALDINDAGQIVGYGYADIHSRQPTPFLLSLAEDSPVKPQDGQLLRYAGDRFHLALPVPIGQAFVPRGLDRLRRLDSGFNEL